MSRILFVLAVVTVWLSAEVAAQAQPEQEPALLSFPPLKVSPDDSPLAKLKKEKVNAVLSALRSNGERIKAGAKDATYGSSEALEIARSLKEAALDLSDPGLRTKLIDGYVELMKFAETQTRLRFEAGSIEPSKYHMVRYYYLDAQVLQLQLRKQAEKK